jgi:hypothetical protein
MFEEPMTLGELKVLLRDSGLPDDTPIYISTDTLDEATYAATWVDVMVLVCPDRQPLVLALRGELADEGTLEDPPRPD